MARILALCLSSLALTAAAAPTAKSYLDDGLRLYNEGRYEDAIRELRLGYALEPLPDILYTLGQSARKLGRCEEAIGYYRQYLRNAQATSASAARFQIERCEQQLRETQARDARAREAQEREAKAREAQAREAQAREADARAAAEHGAVVATPSPPRRPWYRDALGMSLAGVGAAGALAGGGLFIGASETVQRSRGNFQQFDDALARAQTMRTAGIVLEAAGGALLVAGVIRLAVVARRAHGGR